MRRLLLAGLVALVGCTPSQLSSFIAWHEQDPVAAEAFARLPAIDALIHPSDGPQFKQYLDAGSRYGVALWDRIAWCESGGNWSHGPVTNGSGTYSGGVMIGHRWWHSFGGDQFASAPYLASKAQQIVVAERIADEVGLDQGWQCA